MVVLCGVQMCSVSREGVWVPCIDIHLQPSKQLFSPSGITPVVPQARISTLEWFAITQCKAPLQGFPQHPDRAKIQTTRSIQHYNDTELLISRIVAFQCIRSSGKNGPVLATP